MTIDDLIITLSKQPQEIVDGQWTGHYLCEVCTCETCEGCLGETCEGDTNNL